MSVIASAPAKIMLFGEHFVVFGEPAIIMAINQRLYSKATLSKNGRIHMVVMDLSLAGTFDKEKFKAERGSPQETRKERAH